MLLKDKIVIVSGIGPGLGIKLAIEAAREGARGIAIAARSAAKLDDAEARIAALRTGTTVLKCVTDITDRSQCERLIAATVEQFGRVDALVNSAYVHGAFDRVSTANLDSWAIPLNTNLIGTLRLTQAVLPQMKQQGGGAIVMINTMSVRQVPPLGEAGYSASKAALAEATTHLAQEVGPSNIRVNTIHMGWMWGEPVLDYFTAQSQRHNVSIETLRAQVAANIPLRRIPTDDECARAALFLVSDYASAITGAAVDANGGAYMP